MAAVQPGIITRLEQAVGGPCQSSSLSADLAVASVSSAADIDCSTAIVSGTLTTPSVSASGGITLSGTPMVLYGEHHARIYNSGTFNSTTTLTEVTLNTEYTTDILPPSGMVDTDNSRIEVQRTGVYHITWGGKIAISSATDAYLSLNISSYPSGVEGGILYLHVNPNIESICIRTLAVRLTAGDTIGLKTATSAGTMVMGGANAREYITLDVRYAYDDLST